MVIANKTDKPAILTESDQVLNDLKSELANLKSRMNVIEEEQEQNRAVIDRLSYQEDLANEMIENHQKEIAVNRENYQVIATAMQDLKSPVSEVVTNLSGVIAEIDDEKTQNTLKECMNTASNVLNSFDEVEDFCLTASSEFSTTRKSVNCREYFRDLVSEIQTNYGTDKSSFRLLVDKNVPEEASLHYETIKSTLNSLVTEIKNAIPECQTTIMVSSKSEEKKYDIEIRDLILTIETDSSLPFTWSESWLESIRENKTKLLSSGFNLLKARDAVRKSGGYLSVLKKENGTKGFELEIPLSY